MSERRVYVIWTNPIFQESVRLLLKHPEIIWVGTASDIAAAHKEILELRPDTILFEKTSAGIPFQVMDILEEDAWSVRIIGLSLYDNEISVYRRQHHTVGEAGDLLHFILGGL